MKIQSVQENALVSLPDKEVGCELKGMADVVFADRQKHELRFRALVGSEQRVDRASFYL